MSLLNIIQMIPESGNSEWAIDRNSIEAQIDRAFEDLITLSDLFYDKGFYRGIYTSYVYMTTMNTPWTEIKEFLISANALVS